MGSEYHLLINVVVVILRPRHVIFRNQHRVEIRVDLTAKQARCNPTCQRCVGLRVHVEDVTRGGGREADMRVATVTAGELLSNN